jgi:FMN phosphatase YigB (HAD superfamily)
VKGVVLFDLDHTLVDRRTAFLAWAERFAEERGLGAEAVQVLVALDADGTATREEVFGGARRALGLPDEVDELIAAYRRTYFEHFTPDPAVSAALSNLKAAGWRVGVATNGPPSQRHKLERAGLADLVDGCCISEEVGVAKPDRLMFEAAISLCAPHAGQRPTGYMVGDHPVTDIAGARTAGLKTVWMRRGRTWDASTPPPDATVDSVAEAVDLVLHHR